MPQMMPLNWLILFIFFIFIFYIFNNVNYFNFLVSKKIVIDFNKTKINNLWKW